MTLAIREAQPTAVWGGEWGALGRWAGRCGEQEACQLEVSPLRVCREDVGREAVLPPVEGY